MTRIPYLEHCPECTDVVPCEPRRLCDAPMGGVTGWYRCQACLYSWWTGWQREAVSAAPEREDDR